MGDQITSGAFEGEVVDIQIRTTTIHTYDHQMVVIPNAQVFTAPVTNHTRLRIRRYQIDFDTSLSADAEKVKTEALAAAIADEEINNDPAPRIVMRGFDSGSDVLSWRLYFWGKPTKSDEVSDISRMLEQIKIRLYDTGVPTPTSTSATILRRPSNEHDPLREAAPTA